VLLFPLTAAHAQASGSVSLLSDYRFRGISETDRRPAIQAETTYDHSSGVFAGALASNVKLAAPGASGLAVQAYGGYAKSISEESSWDVGAIRYLFPRPATGSSFDYTEVFAGITWNAVNVRLYLSDNYVGSGAHGRYLEFNGSRELSGGSALIVHLGYLRSGAARFAQTHYGDTSLVDVKVGLQTKMARFDLELSVVATTSRNSECPGGSGRCSPTAVLALSRAF